MTADELHDLYEIVEVPEVSNRLRSFTATKSAELWLHPGLKFSGWFWHNNSFYEAAMASEAEERHHFVVWIVNLLTVIIAPYESGN